MSGIAKVHVAGVVFKNKGTSLVEGNMDKLLSIMYTGYMMPHKVDTTEAGDDVLVLVRRDQEQDYEPYKDAPLYSISTTEGECLYMGSSADGCVEYIVDGDNVIDEWY